VCNNGIEVVQQLPIADVDSRRVRPDCKTAVAHEWLRSPGQCNDTSYVTSSLITLTSKLDVRIEIIVVYKCFI